MLVLWYSSWSSFFPFYNFPRRKSVADARHESDRSRVTTKVTRTRHRRRTKAVKEWVNNGFFVLIINIQVVPHRKPINYPSNYHYFLLRRRPLTENERAHLKRQRRRPHKEKNDETRKSTGLTPLTCFFVAICILLLRALALSLA